MKLLELLDTDRGSDRGFGIAIAVVTNNQDPDELGRVKLKFPWLSDADESHWARVVISGVNFLPEVEAEVLVAFEQGDLRFPYVLGTLWNGKQKTPIPNDDGKNNITVIKTRSGHTVRFSDEDGKETIEIIDKSEKNHLKFDTSQNLITLTSEKDITLSAPKGTLTLEAKNIEIKASAKAKLEADQGMDIKASGTLNVKGATINLN
jgi:uncharacterized protein involved in type VI secretion and phage assembly